MSFSRTPIATLRFAMIFVALLSLVLAPVQAVAASAPCSVPAGTTMECGGCCEAMSCCGQAPQQPALPAGARHLDSDFSVALMAAAQPLVGLIPTERPRLFPHASAPLGISPASRALLCVRLL